MEDNHELLSTVTDIQSVRLERLTETNGSVPFHYEAHPTTVNIVPIRHAGMVIRAVLTEPVGTEEHLDKPAIIVKHGFMASRPAYNELAHHLAAAGNRVVHYGMPRSSTKGRQYHPQNLSNPLRTHSQAINGVSRMLHERYPDSPEQHRLIGHSMGGLAVSKFIDHRPEVVESAILLGSAGLAKHSFLEMTQRALDAVGREITPFVRDCSWETKKQLGMHSLWHVGRNPLFLLREGYQAATGNAFPHIDKARSAGVKVGAIWMTDDTFFPEHEIDEDVKTHFDETMFVIGNHLTPQEFPKQAARDALLLFDKLSLSVPRTNVMGLPETIA